MVSALDQRLMDGFPDEWTEPSHWPRGGLTPELLPDFWLRQNLSWLPGYRESDDGGIESARLWLGHLADKRNFSIRVRGRLGLPVFWYFYDRPGVGMSVAGFDFDRTFIMRKGEFVEYLEAALSIAKAEGVQGDLGQLDYARAFE